jgi:hypothetical protein
MQQDEDILMNRIRFAVIGGTLMSMLLALPAVAQQSLGDLARDLRKDKKPTNSKVYTNDNLPTAGGLSVSPAPAPERSAAKDAKTADAAPSDDDRKKAEDEWRKNIGDQKKAIASLEHDIDLMQREYKLRAAIFYADAGNALRDGKKWADDDRKYQSDLADKQKALADAKQKLDDMREQGRKAGVPSSALE